MQIIEADRYTILYCGQHVAKTRQRHVKQLHDMTWRWYFMSISAKEKPCYIAARDALIEMDGPQDRIDWNQEWIDKYS